MRLRTSCFVPPAIAVVAGARGLFTRESLDLQTKITRSSDEQFDALMEGECDAAVTAMDNVVGWNARAGGEEFCIVAQIERTTPLRIVAKASHTSLADLRGGNLLVDVAENGFVVALLAMLADAGISLGAYQLVRAGGVKERFEKMLVGDGDATLLGPPFDGLAMSAGLVSLGVVQEAFPLFPGQGLIVRRREFDRLEAPLEALFRALTAARQLIEAGPEVTEQDLLAHGFPLPAVKAMIAAWPASLAPDKAGIALLIEQRRRLGLTGGDLDYSAIVDTRFLDQAALSASA